MRRTNYEMIQEFHDVFSRTPRVDKPTEISDESRLLRYNLIKEEFIETAAELGYLPEIKEQTIFNCYGHPGKVDISKLAKELADLLYVVYGTADVYGIPMDDVFREVHESNMSKLDDNGKVLRRDDGKVLKGPNYRPPDIAKLLES